MPIFSVASRNALQRLKFEQREKIKFCVKTKISVKKTFQMLQEVYGSKAMSRSRCKDWYLRFKNGRTSVDDEIRSGRPSTSTTPKHIREIDQLVRQDFRISLREISAILNVSFGTVQAILTSTLNLHQVANKLVPRLLTPELKQYQLSERGSSAGCGVLLCKATALQLMVARFELNTYFCIFVSYFL
uniref:Mos1 transposase HTH domain-containing protein n=1 Tax=Pundamilia nyererei TaxID=303518 RepID=A0A3B4F9X0_9CICH